MTTSLPRPARGAWRIVFFALGALLLFAAGMKAYQFATVGPEPDLPRAIEVEAEIVLGLWLIMGVAARYAWGVASLAFALFTMIAGHKFFNGESQCGCFGRLEIKPLYSLLIDLAALSLLALIRRAALAQPPSSRGLLLGSAGAIGLVVIGSIGAWQTIGRPGHLGGDGVIDGPSRVVLLDVNDWTGRPLPIMPYLPGRAEWQHGRWTLMLYHHDCEHCQATLRKMMADQGESFSDLVLVEVSPLGELPPDIHITRARRDQLDPAHNWIVQTPTWIDLQDGKVVHIQQ